MAHAGEVLQNIHEQLNTAKLGYLIVASALGHLENAQVPPHDAIEATAEQEFDAWFDRDKQISVEGTLDNYPSTTFQLVATPNIIASPQDILQLAKSQHDPDTKEFYTKYSGEALSGTQPRNGHLMQFCLFPNQEIYNLYENNVSGHKGMLANRRLSEPSLKVPSVLETLTYRTVHSQMRTIRHFNLTAQQHGRNWQIPVTALSRHSTPLSHSRSNNRTSGYVVLG